MIPDENYRLELFKGSPLNKITYSAVIVERSANGYTVSGYDTTKPYFFMIPGKGPKLGLDTHQVCEVVHDQPDVVREGPQGCAEIVPVTPPQ